MVTLLVVSRPCQVDLRFKVDVANQRAALVKLIKAIAQLGRWSGENPSARISATPGSLRALVGGQRGLISWTPQIRDYRSCESFCYSEGVHS